MGVEGTHNQKNKKNSICFSVKSGKFEEVTISLTPVLTLEECEAQRGEGIHQWWETSSVSPTLTDDHHHFWPLHSDVPSHTWG